MWANSIQSSKVLLLFNKKNDMKNPRDLYFPHWYLVVFVCAMVLSSFHLVANCVVKAVSVRKSGQLMLCILLQPVG